MDNIAIIGAKTSQLQLIKKAREMGYISHVFGEEIDPKVQQEIDYYYKIDVNDVEKIAEKCRQLNVCGVISTGDFTAVIASLRISNLLGLSTNKEYSIRKLEENHKHENQLMKEYSFGVRYSVEILCCKGDFHILAITKTIATVSAPFIRRRHIQPAPISQDLSDRLVNKAARALEDLAYENGAVSVEMVVNERDDIILCNINPGMGDDIQGTHLVYYSTGIDYVKDVIRVAIGQNPLFQRVVEPRPIEGTYILSNDDLYNLDSLMDRFPKNILGLVDYNTERLREKLDDVGSNADRGGCYIAEYKDKFRIAELIRDISITKIADEELYNIIAGDEVDMYLAMAINYIIFDIGGVYNNYPIRMKIHKNIYQKLIDEFEISKYPYREVAERSNKVIIFAEDIKYYSHIDYVTHIYNMLEEIGYEPVIVCLPLTISMDDIELYELNMPARYIDVSNEEFGLNYNKKKYRYLQIELSGDNHDFIRKGLDYIYSLNPLFVFSVGTQSPIADTLQCFTHVMAGSMFAIPPVSVTDFLLSDINDEAEFEKFSKYYDDDVNICNKTIGVFIEEPKELYSKEYFGINPDDFAIAIAGMRLDSEINEEELVFLGEIADIDNRISFVIIGPTEELEKRMLEQGLRVYNIGKQEEMIKTFGAVDLFYNPKRYGGGLSAWYAACAGVPVVTLNEGDVATHMGPDFTYESRPEIIDEIRKYVSNEEFYLQMSNKAKKVIERLNQNSVDDCKEIVNQLLTKKAGK